MSENMIKDLYCRLYVQTNVNENTLREQIAGFFGGNISMRSISDEYIHFRVTKNDDFLPDSMNGPGGFVYFPYTAEVHPKHEIVEDIEPVDPEIFIDLLCHVIMELRSSGALVVASCEYEDLIAKKTGWNWSENDENNVDNRL